MNMIPPGDRSHESTVPQKSNREKEIWYLILYFGEKKLKQMNLFKYEIPYNEYPKVFEKLGFRFQKSQ